jgi:hypothetical protein
MKNRKPLSLFALAFILFCCGSKGAADLRDVGFGKKPAANDCIIGEWKLVENGVTKSFSFSADNTGQESQSPTDIRPYRWETKGAKLFVVYSADASGRSWEFSIDCPSNELRVFGMAYKKNP